MKITYDAATDSLNIRLRSAAISESDEISPSVVADYAADGEIVGFEIMRASTFVEFPDDVPAEFPGFTAPNVVRRTA